MWAYVESNQVVEIVEVLPINWKNVSNLYSAANDIAFLNSLGWYQVTTAQIPTYDAKKQTLLKEYIFNNGVTEQITLQNMYATDAEYIAVCKTDLLPQIRNKRDELLTACDWTQLADVLALHDQIWIDSWTTYRQALRDFPTAFETNSILYIEDVVFPAVPNV
jgi:hypothetical protein